MKMDNEEQNDNSEMDDLMNDMDEMMKLCESMKEKMDKMALSEKDPSQMTNDELKKMAGK